MILNKKLNSSGESAHKYIQGDIFFYYLFFLVSYKSGCVSHNTVMQVLFIGFLVFFVFLK